MLHIVLHEMRMPIYSNYNKIKPIFYVRNINGGKYG